MNFKKQNTEHLDHFHIAGFTNDDGPEAFSELSIGLELDLHLETDNVFNPRAIKITYKHWKLGYIPRQSNRMIHKLLSVGIKNNCLRTQQLDGREQSEKQVQVVAHLLGDR